MSNSAGSSNTAPGLTSVTALLLTWSLLTYVVRVWVKLRRSDGWAIDDTTISLALLGLVLHVVTILNAVNHGYGSTWTDLSRRDKAVVEKSIYASQLFYIVSIGLIKIATGAFNARLTRGLRNVRLAQILSGACGVWIVASLFVIALRGNLQHPWTTLDSSLAMYIRWTVVEAIGLGIEFGLWIVSTHFIWGLQMALAKKLMITAIFAIRLGLTPIVALRLLYLSPPRNENPALPSIMAGVFTELALGFAFMSASVTCLKPFLRPFHSGYFVSTSGSGIPVSGKGTRADTYYMLSKNKSTNDKDEPRSRVTDAHETSTTPLHPGYARQSQPKFRPDLSGHRATVMSQERAHDGDEMTISMTQEWDVTYEEDQQLQKAVTKTHA